MSYGKYGFRGNVPKFNNEVTNAAYNDPWFAAGMLAAQAWNKNYEDRGVRKFIEAEDAKKREKAYAEQQAAQQAQQRAEFINSSGNAQNPAFGSWLAPNATAPANPSADDIQGNPLSDIIAKHIAGQGSSPTETGEEPEATGTLNPIVTQQQGMEQTPTPPQQTLRPTTPQMQSSQGGNAVDPAIQDFVIQAQKAGIIPSYNTQGVLPMNNQQPSIANSLDLKKKDGSDEIVAKNVPTPIVEDKEGNEEEPEGAISNSTGDPAVQQLVAAGKQAGIIKDFQPQSFGQEQLQQAIGKIPADKGKVLSSVQAPVPAQAKSVLNALTYGQPSVDMSFNKDAYLAGVKKDMTKRGFSDERQETILAALMPEAERRQKEVDDVKSSQLLSQVENLKLDQGYNPQVFAFINEMAKTNPQMADLLLKNYVTAKEQYGVKVRREDALINANLSFEDFKKRNEILTQVERERDASRFNYNQQGKIADYSMNEAVKQKDLNNKIALLVESGMSREQAVRAILGFKENDNNSNKELFDNFKIANDRLKYLEEKGKENWSESENKEYLQLGSFISGVTNHITTGGKQPNTIVVNLNDYNQAMTFFSKIIASGQVDNKKMIAGIRENYGIDANDNSNPFVEAIIKDLGLIKEVEAEDTSVSDSNLADFARNNGPEYRPINSLAHK